MELSRYILKKSGISLKLDKPVAVNIKDGTFKLNNLSVRGNRGHAGLRLRANRAQLDGEIFGDIDLSVLEFFTPIIQRTNGQADLSLGVRGTVKEPILNGEINIDKARLQVASLDSPFENIQGKFLVSGNEIVVDSLTSNLASGRVSLGGKILFFTDKLPELDLSSNFLNNKLQIYPFQYVDLTGKVFLKGTEAPYKITGDLKVNSALSREKLGGVGKSKQVARFEPTRNRIYGKAREAFEMDIHLKGDQELLLKNDILDMEFKADVRIVNTPAVPRILGTVDAIKGNLKFKNHVFKIQNANLKFDNPAVINPKISALATTKMKATDIRLQASGRMEDWKVELSSEPALSEGDILSLLAIGLTSKEMNKFQSEDQAVIQQGEAASLLLNSLEFNKDVQARTGFEIQVEKSENPNEARSLFRRQTETDATLAPKIVIKRKIGKRVDVSVGSTVGVGNSTEKEVNAEVHVTPGFSVIGVWNNFEGARTQEEQTSYGVDLKFQKRFK